MVGDQGPYWITVEAYQSPGWISATEYLDLGWSVVARYQGPVWGMLPGDTSKQHFKMILKYTLYLLKTVLPVE